LGDVYLINALPRQLALLPRALQCEKKAVNSQRPVNLDLRTIKLPVTAYTSILHRISGVVLFLGVAALLLALDLSLGSEEGFQSVKDHLASPLVKLVIWALLSALLYHLVAGVRHLIMDMGVGETLQGGKLGSQIVLVVSAVLILIAGWWIW
jgi:succinate dehydrogenase / fumarate reductase cytochrome b subunit